MKRLELPSPTACVPPWRFLGMLVWRVSARLPYGQIDEARGSAERLSRVFAAATK